jgi:hypothetical protein
VGKRRPSQNCARQPSHGEFKCIVSVLVRSNICISLLCLTIRPFVPTQPASALYFTIYFYTRLLRHSATSCRQLVLYSMSLLHFSSSYARNSIHTTTYNTTNKRLLEYNAWEKEQLAGDHHYFSSSTVVTELGSDTRDGTRKIDKETTVW